MAPLSNLGARWGWVVKVKSRTLYSENKRLGTHRNRGWVSPRTGLEGCKKLPPTGFDSQAVQPVASRYTEYRFFFFCFLYFICTSLSWASQLCLLPFTVQHTQHKQPSHRRDSNPQPQQAIGRKPSPYTARPLGSALLTVQDLTQNIQIYQNKSDSLRVPLNAGLVTYFFYVLPNTKLILLFNNN